MYPVDRRCELLRPGQRLHYRSRSGRQGPGAEGPLEGLGAEGQGRWGPGCWGSVVIDIFAYR